MDGGGHERGLRSGTLNVPGIVGFGEAASVPFAERQSEADRIRDLRDRLEAGLAAALPDITVNGDPSGRLPHNASITFVGARADWIMMEMKDVAVSAGSACGSADAGPSHVLKALGLAPDAAASTLRFGLGRFTTEEEIDYTIRRVVETVAAIRARMPKLEPA
jgi:cysteine desulfurase